MIKSPIANITVSEKDLKRFTKLTGQVLTNGEWEILSDEIPAWKRMSFGERKTHVKSPVYLPARTMNFQFALLKNGFNIKKAIEFVEREMFNDDAVRSPIYLHDYLCHKAGLDVSEHHPEYSYSRILKGYDDAVKNITTERVF